MSQLTMLSAVRIAADRVVLRKAHDGDRERLVELRTDPDAYAYLGGPSSREAVEQRLAEVGGPAAVTAAPGLFVVADQTTDDLLGTLDLKRSLPEHGGELELGYLMRPAVWGAGLAFEATTAALRAAADELPDQPVVLFTQSANTRSLRLAARLGFRPVETFVKWGAEQTVCRAELYSFKG